MPGIASLKAEEHRQHLAWKRKCLVRERKSNVPRFSKARAATVDAIALNLTKAAEVRLFVEALRLAPEAPRATKRLAHWAAVYADHPDPLVDFRLANLR